MFYGWYVVSACVLISMFFSGTIYMGFTAIIEPVSLEMGWSYTQISLAASLRGLETGLLVVISGMIMDRYGPRVLILSGCIITGIGLFLLSSIHSLIMFYVSFGIICIGISTVPTSLLMSAVANWFKKRQSLAMGITASGVSLGGILIPVVTLMVDTYGWRQGMFTIGVAAWIIPLPLSLVLRHKPEKYGYLPDGETKTFKDHEVSPVNIDGQMGATGLKEVLSSMTFWIIALAFLFHVMTLSAVTTHIMPFFSNIGIKRTFSSLITSSIPIIGIIGRIGFGWLGDRMDRIKIATFALALTGVGVWLLFLVSMKNLWLIPIFIVVFGIGWGGIVPMLPGLVIKFFGKNRLASISGCISSIMMVGMIIGAPLAGWIFDRKGSYGSAWLILGTMLMIMMVIFFSHFQWNRGEQLD